MKSKGFVIGTLLAVLVFCAGSAWAATSASGPAIADQEAMIRAAATAGVSIYPDQMSSSSSDGASVTAATLRGYEQVDPANIAKGTDVGFIHLDAPRSGIPAGFYRLRASAAPAAVRVGTFSARVDLIDGSGRTVGSLPATAEASSLQVPDPLPFARTAVQTSITSGNTHEPRSIIIIIICPNGLIIIIWLPW